MFEARAGRCLNHVEAGQDQKTRWLPALTGSIGLGHDSSMRNSSYYRILPLRTEFGIIAATVNRREQVSDELPVACFKTTHWTEVLQAGAAESPGAREALARLCKTYWLPIYTFIRKRGHNLHEAQDLTQEFFATFLEKKRVAHAIRERGRFRCFLMASVENFLRNAHDHANAIKRGGGQEILSLNHAEAEELYIAAAGPESDPARAFEQRWALTLLQTVLVRLKEEFSVGDRAKVFEALQAHIWGDGDSEAYSVLAERFGLSLANIKIMAHRLRARYGALLREEIGRTVSHPGEIDDELRYLMRVVSAD
jgi:RNA polymerase sigma-70 factor (ECF subfamily)